MILFYIQNYSYLRYDPWWMEHVRHFYLLNRLISLIGLIGLKDSSCIEILHYFMFQREFSTRFRPFILFNTLKNFQIFSVLSISFLVHFHSSNFKPYFLLVVFFSMTRVMRNKLSVTFMSSDQDIY